MTQKNFQNLLTVLTLVCGACLIGCAKAESYEKPLTPVKVKTVEQQYVATVAGGTGSARYSANIQPDSQVDLAFKIGGYVEQLLSRNGRTVQEGDWVAKGAVLARIRDNDVAARVKQAKANLAEAQAAQSQVRSQLAEAETAQNQTKSELERAARLFEKESLTRPDYETAKSNFDMGRARLDAIKAQLAMAEAKVNSIKAQIEEIESLRADCELKAPMNGLLLKRNVEIGSLVAPGAPAFVIADTASVKAVFGVPDVVAARLKSGTHLTVETEAISGIEFRGRLLRVSPSADPKTRVFDVEVAIANPGQKLKTGMVVSLQSESEGAQTPVTVAPLTSLMQLKEKNAGYAVFVVEDQNGRPVVRQRRVKLGETLGNMIAVTDGISAGEQVVVSGVTMISDGEPVKVVQ